MQGCKDRCFKLGVEDRGKMLAEIMDFGRLSLHNFLPLFFDKLEDIFSFLPEKKVIIKRLKYEKLEIYSTTSCGK